MKIKEVLELEKNNISSILLIKEGMFWRAYEKSALRFLQHLHTFRVNVKYFKNIKQKIVFLGFPESSLEKILKKAEIKKRILVQKTDDLIELEFCKEEGDFEKWKESLGILNPQESDFILRKILKFSVAEKTPLEALEFLQLLQSDVQQLRI